jgi:hypothetical protein
LLYGAIFVIEDAKKIHFVLQMEGMQFGSMLIAYLDLVTEIFICMTVTQICDPPSKTGLE